MRPFALVLFGCLATAPLASTATDIYPVRPIRMIVPFPPGGNVETLGRVLFHYVEQDLGSLS
jgi:tripartite-type tricarboxylate transporter receptor subunit TctC